MNLVQRMCMATLAGALMLAAATAYAAEPPLVDADWLEARRDAPDLTILDVGRAPQAFALAHIPGAVWTDFREWRARVDGTDGVYPGDGAISALLGRLGVNPDSHVVIVPAGASASDMATGARLYWTLTHLGHERLSLLDGGFTAYAMKPSRPLEHGNTVPDHSAYKPKGKGVIGVLATQKDVLAAVTDASAGLLVDARTNDIYLGINRSSKVARAGTLPGARNLPDVWLTRDGGGTFRSTDELRALFAFAGVAPEASQIHFCNSGRHAALTWFAAYALLGNANASLYDASLLEWAEDVHQPLVHLAVSPKRQD